MANGNGSEGGATPLWYALGAFVLIAVMMATIAVLKPLQFTAPAAAHCEEAACERGAPAGEPEGVSHEHAAPPAAAPEGASHAAPPPHE